MRIHLDTDIAGDTDDAAALVMLLGLPDAEITGITTVADPDGLRAGYARRILAMAGREEIPVVAGAGVSSTTGRPMGGLPDHRRYWGDDPMAPWPSPQGAAVELLAASAATGAVIVGIGPYTNLAALEAARPGTLARTRVVLMGGWVRPPARGLPPWGPEMDWNVQCDTRAALAVFAASGETMGLVTLPATLGAHLRQAHLARLEASGRLGRLLARQARAHAEDHHMAELASTHSGLPADLLNFQYDPVACAAALGPSGATVEVLRLRPVQDAGVVRFEQTPDGKPTHVVTAVDDDAFSRIWLGAVEHADRRGSAARPPGER